MKNGNSNKIIRILISMLNLIIGIFLIYLSGRYSNNNTNLMSDFLYTIGVLFFVTISFQFIFDLFIKKIEGEELKESLVQIISNTISAKKVTVFFDSNDHSFKTFDSLLNEAKYSILICGTSLINTSYRIELLKKKIETNKKFKITLIMMNLANDLDYLENYAKETKEYDFIEHLKKSYYTFLKFKYHYPNNIDIYLYNSFPFFSSLLIDKGKEVNKMTITYYLHGLYPPQCPGLQLSSEINTEKEFIKIHELSLDELMKNSSCIKFLNNEELDYWAKRSKDYDNLKWVDNDFLIKDIEEMLNLDINKRDEILDIGSGTGVLGQKFGNRAKTYIGIDICPEMIIKSYEKDIPNTIFIYETATNLPFSNDRFNVIIGRMVLHHITQDLDLAIKECYRVLKPGGHFIICEGIPSDPRANSFYEQIFKIKEKRNIFTEESINRILQLNKFKVINTKESIIRSSLNNWLNNCNLSKEKIAAIRNYYETAPENIQQYYNTENIGGDILFDAKFITICSTK